MRLALDFGYPEPRCGEPDGRPGLLRHMHYLYFSMVLGAATALAVLVVSVATEPPAPEMVRSPPPRAPPAPNACQGAPGRKKLQVPAPLTPDFCSHLQQRPLLCSLSDLGPINPTLHTAQL